MRHSLPYLTCARTLAYKRNVRGRRADGSYLPGFRASRATEFQPGQHWRPRKPFWGKTWLAREYGERGRSAGDIAAEFGVTDTAILFWLDKHGIARRSISEARALKHWGVSGAANPMYGKRDEANPRWTGRWPKQRRNQRSEYVSWRAAVIARAGRYCVTCGKGPLQRARQLHVHHVRSWREHPELRFDPLNGTVLCAACHFRLHVADRARGRRTGRLEVGK